MTFLHPCNRILKLSFDGWPTVNWTTQTQFVVSHKIIMHCRFVPNSFLQLKLLIVNRSRLSTKGFILEQKLPYYLKGTIFSDLSSSIVFRIIRTEFKGAQYSGC